LRRTAAVAVCVFLMVTVVLVVGCGDSSGDGVEQDNTSLVESKSMPDTGETSLVGAFEAPDGRSITFYADGTFTTADWIGMGDGTYELVQGQLGVNVDLSINDGSGYTMYVMIAIDEVVSVNDAEGVMFKKE